MLNKTMPDLEQEKLDRTTLDVNRIKQILERSLTSNSLENEALGFFREIAALRGKNVDDTLSEMIAGTQKYLEAVNTHIEFDRDIPTDINKYADKLVKISEGIEACWDFFSIESQEFFINVAANFCCVADSKFKGWKGFLIRLRLIFPSLKQKQNLFKKYQESFLFIPKAVDRVTEVRKNKSILQLHQTGQSLLKRAKEINGNRDSLLPFLKHLGRDEQEQIEKNQAAMAWAKARLEEIKVKRNG
jgi:hypothetical protein